MSSRLPILFLLGCLAGSVPAADDPKLDAQLAKDLQPKLVTLKAKDISLAKALQAIRAQTGFEVMPPPDTDITLKNIDLNKVPFWQAVDKIAEAADVRVYLYGKERKISLVKDDRGYREVPVSYSGMFRVVLKKIVLARDLEDDTQGGVATLEVAWEPRFQAFFLDTKLETLEVKDDKGLALEVPAIARGRAPTGDALATQIEVPLPAFRRAVVRIGSMSGTLSMIGSPKLLTFTFDKLVKRQELTQEGVTLTMKNFKEGKELWTADIGLKYPSGGPKFESFESWFVKNECYLVNKSGKRLDPAGYEAEEGTMPVMRYRFIEDDTKQIKLGKSTDWRLIYRTPAQVADVPIKFAFKDVPLP